MQTIAATPRPLPTDLAPIDLAPIDLTPIDLARVAGSLATPLTGRNPDILARRQPAGASIKARTCRRAEAARASRP